MWPALFILALVALAAVHLFWRRAYSRARADAARELDALRNRSEQQTQEIEARQKILFDSMIEGLLVLDEGGRIQWVNSAFAKLFDITTGVHGKTVLEVLRLHELGGLIERVAEEKVAIDYELKQTGLTERWLRVNAAAVFNGGGRQQGTILVFHDLTRLKQLERTREEFVANVSHELRTPLSLIKGYVETLLDGAKDNPEVETKFLQTIQRNSERLQFLIEDLLTISELEAGRLKMNLRPVKLRPLADKIIEDLKAQAAARGILLVNEVPDLSAHADGDRILQVFSNLVSNAIKYGSANGCVTLVGAAGNGMLELCVRDDGPGIPLEALDRVFERFYRVDKARSREQGGTGLGLSIVKHIVQSHGGRVWVKSELGQGAQFYFTLPMLPAEQS